MHDYPKSLFPIKDIKSMNEPEWWLDERRLGGGGWGGEGREREGRGVAWEGLISTQNVLYLSRSSVLLGLFGYLYSDNLCCQIYIHKVRCTFFVCG